MAIYHLHSKIITRSKGQSAVAAAAYRQACRLQDERLMRTFDYQNKPHVIHSELVIPPHAPAWVQALAERAVVDVHAATGELWNKVEAAEKRHDAQLARELEFSLPIELTIGQNIALAREFITDQFVQRGMIANWNVHWDSGNPHVHVMLTMRDLTEDGFGLKRRDWNANTLHLEWREKWAEYINFHLRLHQHEVCVDYRSYQAQGIDLIPMIHQGQAVTDQLAKGQTTSIRLQRVNQIRRENLKRIAADPQVLLTKLEQQSSTLTHETLGQALGGYLNDQGQFSCQRSVDHASVVLAQLER